jgi:hypothetical protein
MKPSPILKNCITILRELKLHENHAFKLKKEIRKILSNKTGLSDRSIKSYLSLLLNEGLLSYYYDRNGWHIKVHSLVEEHQR